MSDRVWLRLLADTQHGNARGFVHGGIISALDDDAAGLSCAQQHHTVVVLIAIRLRMDWTSPGLMDNFCSIEQDVFHAENQEIYQYHARTGLGE